MIERRKLLKGIGIAVGAGVVAPSIIGRSSAQSPVKLLIKGVYSSPGLSFAGILLADRAGLWANNGLQAEVKQVQGGPLAMVALTNREAQFSGVASTDPIIGWDKGIKTIAISAFTGALDMQITAHKDWMSRVGVSPKSSLEDKLKALKGARVGASTIGGGPAQYVRYLAGSVGIDPSRDMQIVAVGFGAARMAALRTKQVDVTVGSAPESDQVELEGFGALFLDCTHEVPLFREFPYTVAIVTPQLANDQPDVVRRIAQTLGQANDMFHTRFGEAVDILKQVSPNIPGRAIETALERSKDGFPRSGRMTAKMWENSVKVAVDIKMISKPLPTEEGVLWTNKFLG
jgi:ABC-type nitrate/sulfonate/bicarbonate transport system substrate-binding protein